MVGIGLTYLLKSGWEGAIAPSAPTHPVPSALHIIAHMCCVFWQPCVRDSLPHFLHWDSNPFTVRTYYILTYYVYYCFMHEPASPQRVVQRITSITKQGEGRTQLSFALFSLLPFGKCICNPPAKVMKSYVRFNFRRYLMLIICNIAKNHTSITKHDE